MPSKTYLAPAGLEHKAALASPESGLIEADETTGVVEAIVSVTGVVDEDRDVIKPGAYAKTLQRRRPKGIFVHDWGRWVARTEHIEELMPGDSRLPKKTKDGKPWPKEAGGLYVRARFNLDTKEGADAFSNVKFFSESGECEWSVGYKVPHGKSTKTKTGERHIEEMDLFEYSPVLFGAAPLSGTLSVKSAPTVDNPDLDEEDEQDAAALAAEEEEAQFLANFTFEELEAAADQVAEEELEEPHLPDPEPVPQQEPEQEPETEPEDPRAQADGDDLDEAPEQVPHQEEAPQEEAPEVEPPLDEPTRPEDAATKRMGTGLDRSPRKNWVEMTGRLPAYIEEVAKSIHEKRGMPLERAIPIAIAQIKKWARGGEDVDPDTKAKAAKALAQWEALKARNAARKKDADTEALESITYPWLPGTYEELREQLRQTATKTLSTLSAGLAHVEVMATWQDRTVVTAYQADGKALSYEIPYAVTYGDGRPNGVELDEPVPVELKVSLDDQEEDGHSLLPYPSVIEGVALDLKTMFGLGETKAGRVLSAVNEKRLLAAVESLVAVLREAGLEVDATPRTKQEEEERDRGMEANAQYQDSTAPSARAQAGKVLLEPALLARAYRVLGEKF